MKITLHRLLIRDVLEGYRDSAEEGVTAYAGRLDIRPKYQREFVYRERQRDAVVESIQKDLPLNVMYWMVRDDGGYEVLDGQQRTISVGQYVTGKFSLDDRYFNNLTDAERRQILDYELMIYFCEGTDKERLDWFRIINIAGEKLTDQEIRNAVYTGPWLSDAKLKFSKTGCAAYELANDGGKLVSGSPIRQDYLETALSWISDGDVAAYMSLHQHDRDADELWQYFQAVIGWVRKTFTVYRSPEMSKVCWGGLYNQYGGAALNAKELEAEIRELMEDEDVGHKSGVYPYVLTRQEKHLSLRTFSDKVKREAYERQRGVCPKCEERFGLDDMEADHVTPWHAGGRTVPENCQMLCRSDNRAKSGK